MSRYVLALDQGTTSSRAILFDRQGTPCAMSQKELTQHYPEPGHVEHDPEEIWTTQLAAARQAGLKPAAPNTSSQAAVSARGIA